MATLPSFPPPPPPPTDTTSQSPFTLKWTRKASWLWSLATRPAEAKRSVVHVDPVTGKANSPHKKKLRTYLGIVARDKVDVTYKNWKQVPTAQKDLIWEDYLVCCCLVQRNNLLFRNDEIDIEQVWKMVRVRSWAWLHSKTRIFHFSMFDWWRQPSLGLKGTYGSFL